MKTIKKLLNLFLLMGPVLINAQIGIGTITPDASAMLDVSSSTKGILFPRMTTIERNGITNPAEGLIIYNSDEKRVENNIGTLVGGPVWEAFGKTGLTGPIGPTGPMGSVSTSAGGTSSVASGAGATVVGGIENSALGTASTIAGGGTNTASGTSSTIVGGMTNIVNKDYATVSGGLNNTACGIGATVAGGVRNEACGDYATIAGGTDNKASVNSSTVAGGTFNSAIGINSVVSGGYKNSTAGLNASVAGGSLNSASGKTASVAGGESNVASGDYATVSGGGFNFAPSYGEWVGGMYGTTYAAGSNALFVDTDRIFNVGNGTGLGTRSDAFTVLKNGLATLPSVTNTLIAADPSGKAIVTKEYLEYKEVKVIGVTTYTLLQSDVSLMLYFTAGSPVSIFVPSGLRVGSRFEGKQIGVGQLVFSGTAPATLFTAAKDTQKTAGQFSTFSLDWIAADAFLLFGSLELKP